MYYYSYTNSIKKILCNVLTMTEAGEIYAYLLIIYTDCDNISLNMGRSL
jgi:hypothetical protein